MPRIKLEGGESEVDNNYFTSPKSNLEFIDSGCAVLNCTLGGGWPLSRIANIVGDESTGKTLLAIEALSNFHKKFPNGKMYYRESESAFDENYAAALGMPVDKVEFIDPEDLVTVEDFYDDLCRCIKECRSKGVPGAYFLDSFDGLTTKAELKKEFDESTFGTQKAKDMHKLMRFCSTDVSNAKLFLGIISQTKDNIGSMFVKKTRSGGNALNFWSSQILWLSNAGDDTRTINKVERVTGVKVRAKCTKNKISLPHRQCEFTIRFDHGIDSLFSGINWLEKVHRLDEVIDCDKEAYRKRTIKMTDDDYWEESNRIDLEVVRIWEEIEKDFSNQTRAKRR